MARRPTSSLFSIAPFRARLQRPIDDKDGEVQKANVIRFTWKAQSASVVNHKLAVEHVVVGKNKLQPRRPLENMTQKELADELATLRDKNDKFVALNTELLVDARTFKPK